MRKCNVLIPEVIPRLSSRRYGCRGAILSGFCCFVSVDGTTWNGKVEFLSNLISVVLDLRWELLL